jgi:hypothetical protein
MYSNSQIFAAVINHWIQPFVSSIAASKLQGNGFIQTIENSIKKWLPVSPSYSFSEEIGWAVSPIAKNMIEPRIQKFISQLPEESIPQAAHDLVDAMLEKSESNKTVSFFEILLVEHEDVLELKRILTLNMPIPEKDNYTVKI